MKEVTVSLFIMLILLGMCSVESSDTTSGSIFGVVSEELGKVVVGATVKLYTQEDTLVTSVTSSNKGFTINNVAPGNYYIEIEMEGYEKFKSSVFTVKPKERYNIETLELKAQKGILNVTVQDKDENKLNAEVTIKLNNEVVEKKTAENGEVSFQLNGGKYTIEASLEGYKTETVEVDVFGGKTVTKSIILSSGTVTTPPPTKKGSLKITVKDEKDNPISDVNVFIDNEFKGKTDEDGILLIEDIEEGGHSIRLTKVGFIDKSFTKDVVGGMIVTKSIILSPSAIMTTPPPMKKGSLKITVTDKKGNPISNVNVFIDNEMKGKTDQEGILLIENIEGGKHSIRLTKAGFIDKSFTKDVVGEMIVEEILTITEEKPLSRDMPPLYIMVVAVLSIVGAYFFLNTKKKQEKVFIIKGLMKCKEGTHMIIRESIKEASTELLRDIKEHPWKYEYDSNDEESKQIYEEVCEELRRRTKEEKGSIERSYGTWESLSGLKSSQKKDVGRFWRSFIVVLAVLIGGVLALIGTSLPWISAGPVSLSGMVISDAISWLERFASMMDEPIPTEIRLFGLIPAFIVILGILCIVFAILGLVKPKAGGTGSLVCGLLIVIFSIISIIVISESISVIKEMMEVVPFVGGMVAGMIGVGYGLYLCILGGLLALIGGVVGKQ